MPLTQFADLIESHARTAPDGPCFRVDDTVIGWRQLELRTRGAAQRLLELAGGRPTRVAVRSDEPLEFITTLFAAVRCGAAVVPLPGRLRDESLAALLADCAAPIVVASDREAQALRRIAPATSNVVAISELARDPAEADARPLPRFAVDPDSELLVLYSSGTTSAPKGVVHTHRTRCAAAENAIRHYHVDAHERTLITAPLYTARGLVPMLATAYAGGCSIVTTATDSARVLDAVARCRPTTVDMVPTQFATLLDDPSFDPEIFGDCRLILSTGAPLHPRLRERLFGLFPTSFIEVYGSTEADFVARLPRRCAVEKRGSVGTPRGVQIRILDTRDEPVGADAVGEIVVCGAATMLRYTDAAATRQAFWVEPVTGQRYFRTGDLGWLDGDGYLWLASRKKDMIITAGFNVFPADLEDVLVRHPDVRQAAVVGLPHAVLGETPLAFVVLRAASEETQGAAGQICRWANARLNANQRLYDVRVLPDLPRNANGKVLKTRLRELAHGPP